MNKTFIIVVLALFAVASFAQGFRPNSVPTKVSAPRAPRLDDAQDNNLAHTSCFPKVPQFPKPVGGFGGNRFGFDDAQDNDLALDLSPATLNRAIREADRYVRNDYRVKVGRWDDAQDNNLARFTVPGLHPDIVKVLNNLKAKDDAQDNDLALDLSPYPAGMNVQKAISDTLRVMNNDYRVKVGRWDDAQDNNLAGVSASVRPSGNAGVSMRFDDFEDDTLFTQRDQGRMSNFFELRQYPIQAGGGSVRGQGARLAVGVDAQFTKNLGKNLDVIYGGRVGHAPGSKVSVEPFVGIKKSF